MRVGFFLREATRSMSRNAVPSFAAMASVLVTVLVLGMFIPVVQATTGAANDVRSRVLVNVYLKTDAKPADVERVRDLLQTKVEHVGDHPAAHLVGGAGRRLDDRDEDAEQHDRDEHGGHRGERRHRVALDRAQRLAQEEPELHGRSSRSRAANSRVDSSRCV